MAVIAPRRSPLRLSAYASVASSSGDAPVSSFAFCSSAIASSYRPIASRRWIRPAPAGGAGGDRQRGVAARGGEQDGGAIGAEALEGSRGFAAVVRVAVVGDHAAIRGDGVFVRADRLVRAGRPVQPRRTIVRAAQRRRRRLEQADRLAWVAALVRPPPRAPGRAIGEGARGKRREHAREHVRRRRVVVGEDVVRPEIVQRRLGQRRAGMILDEPPHRRDVLVVPLQTAQRGEIGNLGLVVRAWRLGKIRPQRVARRGKTAQADVALRQTQVQLPAIVAGGAASKRLERLARVRVTSRGEQHLRALRLERVAIGNPVTAEPRQRDVRILRLGRQRQLVVDLRIGRARGALVARALGRLAQTLVGQRRARNALLRQRVVRRHGIDPVAGDHRRIGQQPQRGLAQRAAGRSLEDQPCGRDRAIGLARGEIGATEIQLRVAAELGVAGLSHQNRDGIVGPAGAEHRHGPRQIGRDGLVGRRREPEIASGKRRRLRQCHVGRRLERSHEAGAAHPHRHGAAKSSGADAANDACGHQEFRTSNFELF
jgi:hypothetical protein